MCFGHDNIDTMWFDVVRPPEAMILKRIRSVSALRSYSSALTLTTSVGEKKNEIYDKKIQILETCTYITSV